MAVKIKVTEPFKILYNLPEGTNTVICIGGRAGMKTYEVSKWATFSATIKTKRIVVLRDEASLIKESILNEIWQRYETANGEYGILDQSFIKNENELKDRKTGKTLIYTKGFRASSNTKRANLKGPSDIDIAIMEEIEDLRDPEKFNTFVDGLRKEGCIVVLLLNVPDINHFIVKRYFNLEQVEDGYYKISPKQIPGLVCIQTNYTDNPFLPKHVIDNYEGYGKVGHHLYNKHYYMTAIKGYASTGRKGQIITKAKPISLKDYMALPFKEIYGQDFGTASPAALIGVKFDGNNCYARQINYDPKNTLQLGILYCELGFTEKDEIIADYADKEACDKLYSGFTSEDASQEILNKYPQLKKGFFVTRCIKPKGTTSKSGILYGIDLIDSLNLFIVEESTDFWNEILNYCYAQDKYGNYVSEPIDDFNHAIDSLRYVIYERFNAPKFYVK